jgi:hypothetical protein
MSQSRLTCDLSLEIAIIQEEKNRENHKGQLKKSNDKIKKENK